MKKLECWKGAIKPYLALKVIVLILASSVISTGTLPIKTTAIAIILSLVALISSTMIKCAIGYKDDTKRKEKTPLTEKKTTVDDSKETAIGLVIISILISAIALNTTCAALMIINTAITITYSIYRYKYPIKSLFEGITAGLIILFGGFAQNPKSPVLTELILVLAAIFALTTAAMKISKDIAKPKDMIYPENTIASRYDKRTAAAIAATLILIAIFASIIPVPRMGSIYLYIIGTSNIILAYSGLRVLIKTTHSVESHRFIKISMILILVAFLIAAI